MSSQTNERPLNVINNEKLSRFEVKLDGDDVGFMEYRREGSGIIFTHTEVPPAYRGQGIADKIAKSALDFAQQEHLGVIPLCPFVKKYIDRHAEYQPLVLDWK